MRYFIKTYGCQMNKSDSERIAGFLKKSGWSLSPAMEKADLIVVNMCSVRQSAVDRIFGLAPKFKKLRTSNFKLQTMLTGCFLKRDRKKFSKFFDYIAEKDNFSKILNLSEVSPLTNWPTFRGSTSKKEVEPLKIKDIIGYVPISCGCNNFCVYCVVPYTRGRLVSRPVSKIIREVKKLVKRGCREIWLLGQNVNDYKSQIPMTNDQSNPNDQIQKIKTINFAELLKTVDDIPGEFRIFFTSPHPKNFSDELINALAKCKKFSRQLNLPMQSGDNEILKKMKRNYTAEEYKKLTKKIRQAIPDIKISTDAIVGFPGETKKQFENTAKLFKEIGFYKAYVSEYSPRPGTAAEKMRDNVPKLEKKRRKKMLEALIIGEKNKKPKLIVILGPTASGKTELSIKLAKKFRGEIVSADSRQIYSEMAIGTASPFLQNQKSNLKNQNDKSKFKIKKIPHHLFHIISPKQNFSVAEYQKLAIETIKNILEREKIPFLVGGSAFYVYAVTEGWQFPKMKANLLFRKQLEKKSVSQLFTMLKKSDPQRAETIEKQNKRRLIRAIEITEQFGITAQLKNKPQFDCLILAVEIEKEKLKQKISTRVEKMLKVGLEKEVKRLVRKYGWNNKALETIGYQEWKDYFAGKIKKEEIIKKIKTATWQFSRRQMTWFKRDSRIHWVKNQKQAEKLIIRFLN